jgi:hypothetical protein
MNVLLDDVSPVKVRGVLGRLLASADTADIAVAHVRLHAIDLSRAETQHVRRCRILLGRLDSSELQLLGLSGNARRARLDALREFLTSGRVEVRSAGMGAWTPDFSLFDGICWHGSKGRAVCIIGAHYFHEPPVAGGPSFTCVLTDTAAAARARRRFEELWSGAHDVHHVVVDAIDADCQPSVPGLL